MKTGFSLIELMIVIVIIGILSSLAIPSYHHYLITTRRQDATASLLDLAKRMESYFAENSTFATATLNTGATTDVSTTNQSFQHFYTLTIAKQDDTSYTLYAIPNQSQRDDSECQTLTLDNYGYQGIHAGPYATPTGTTETCW